jgi:hypothetical protein
MQNLFSILILFSLFALSSAQERKSVEALRINTPMVIDGILDEGVYQKIAPARDFTQLMPYSGRAAYQPTEVYFFYDNTAIIPGCDTVR